MATTVHGNFFSQKNKEHVSNMVFAVVKDNLGVELDETFVASLLQIMSEAYTNNTKDQKMNISDYINTLNNIVVKKCYEKVKLTNNKVDLSKLLEKEFSEREYTAKEDVKKIPVSEEEPIPVTIYHEPRFPAKKEEIIENTVKQQHKYFKKILDFRRDLIDIENNIYFLNLHDTYTIKSIDISKFMIEVSENLTSEPYFYIDIENIDPDCKTCFIENDKKVIGRMIQSSTVCNKTMYVYEPEDCIITLSNNLKTNFLKFSFYNYEGVKISLNNISIKKIIKCSTEDENRYQILSNGSNSLKINESINVLSKKSIDKLKNAVYWEVNNAKIKDCKHNSIILDNFTMTNDETVILEKRKINSNISLLLCVE